MKETSECSAERPSLQPADHSLNIWSDNLEKHLLDAPEPRSLFWLCFCTGTGTEAETVTLARVFMTLINGLGGRRRQIRCLTLKLSNRVQTAQADNLIHVPGSQSVSPSAVEEKPLNHVISCHQHLTIRRSSQVGLSTKIKLIELKAEATQIWESMILETTSRPQNHTATSTVRTGVHLHCQRRGLEHFWLSN